MIIFAALIVVAILFTMVRFGIFGFYAAVVPIFTLIGAYEFLTGKQRLETGEASSDPVTVGLLGLSGTDWIQIAVVAWAGLAICIFYIKSGLVGKHGQFSQRLMCGPWL